MGDSVPAPALPTASDGAGLAPALSFDDRYAEERLLGRGAMGAVYLVRDRETGEQLAVKKLFHMDARSVLRLKREFRAIADMSHPNLVKVYELGHAADGYFLAMEYVPGRDLQAHLELERRVQAPAGLEAAFSQLAARRSWLQESALPAFHQLAAGVHALHRAGMLHRDLKPSNVLVAKDRVVVLDFGLVRELDVNAPKLTEDGAIAGTPAYMAPEQALGKPLSEASDWYAFGAMLYEALTGVLPFEGAPIELLRSKIERDPPPPHSVSPEIPESLSALCTALLSRDPARRPSGRDVLSQLQEARPRPEDATADRSGDTSLLTETRARVVTPFFGRKAELAALTKALEDANQERSQVVHVRGVSGTGKSALVEHFLDELEGDTHDEGSEPVLVLRSRCYEREAMPFKALDGVIDALTRQLSHLDDLEIGHLMPADIGSLAQLFPVLERLRAVQRLLSLRSVGGDAMHNRQRAELAFRELLSRLARRRPVVIWIDDVQWGDLDSAGILKGFLQKTLDLPFVLLLSYRSDEVNTSECLRVLLSTPHHEQTAPTTVVQVEALPLADLSTLCRAQLGALGHGQEALIAHIVREAHGSPFLAAQLTALALAKLTRGDADVAAISLSGHVAETAALLPPDARLFLRVLAIAGRPIPPRLALRAADLRGGGREIIHALRRQLLVRTRDVSGEKLIEVYHDRVREGVHRSISDEDCELLHRQLLHALEHSGRADPDWLYTHAIGARQLLAAFRYGSAAAERAMSTLAFEHAAELYASCIELSDGPDQERGELLNKLAGALACCGRGRRAADAYLQSAMLTSGHESVKRMQLATSHLFRSGRFAEADAMLQRVLVAMDVRMPATRVGTAFSVLWQHLLLKLRGTRLTPRNEAEVPAALLERIDAFSFLQSDLHMVDPLRGMWFMLRGMRWAFDAGERLRALHFLSTAFQMLSLRGTRRSERRRQQMIRQIGELEQQIGSPFARAIVRTTEAISSWYRHDPAAVAEASYEAERLWREHASEQALGGYAARFNVVAARIGAFYQLGDYRAFARELDQALAEARATENCAAELAMALNETLLDDIRDRGEQAVERLTRQRRQLPQGYFAVYHALHMMAVCCAASTTGRYAWGLAVVDEDWPRFLRSGMQRSMSIAMGAHLWRMRLLRNACVVEPSAAVRRSAERGSIESAKFWRSLGGTHAEAALAVAQARDACVVGDSARAIPLLRRVVEIAAFDPQPNLYALGRILGGGEGAQLCADAERQLREQGVVNPIAYVRGRFPELFPERGANGDG